MPADDHMSARKQKRKKCTFYNTADEFLSDPNFRKDVK